MDLSARHHCARSRQVNCPRRAGSPRRPRSRPLVHEAESRRPARRTLASTAAEPTCHAPPVSVSALPDSRAAQELVARHARRTPLLTSRLLSEETGFDVRLKAELFQRTGSYKLRGPLVKLARLSQEERARELVESGGLTYVHPFDDVDLISGQGTVGIEVLEDWPEVELIVVPIGGGGLISGIATAVKRERPDVRVVGVESADGPAMKTSVELRRARHARPR